MYVREVNQLSKIYGWSSNETNPVGFVKLSPEGVVCARDNSRKINYDTVLT